MIGVRFRVAAMGRRLFWGALAAAAFLTTACENQNKSTPPLVGASPTPTPTPNPSPVDSNHVAFVVKLAPEAISGPPNASPGATNIYITGQQTSTGAGAICTNTFLEVTDAQGDTAPFPTGGAAVTAIPFYGGATTSGNTSQVIQLPALCSARIYISVNGPLSITTASGPAPWAFIGSTGFPEKYDMLEYTMPANGLAAPSMDVDTSQENMIGLDLALTLVGTQSGTQTTGVKDGFMTQVNGAAADLGTTWGSVINAQWPTRLLSPLSVQYVTPQAGNASLPGFNPGTFLDATILSAWNQYHSPNCMNLTVSNATADPLSGKVLYGQVDALGTFDFYDPAFVGACVANLKATQSAHIVAQIPSPFDSAFWIGNVAGGWSTASGSELMENGPFLLPVTAVSSGGPASFVNPYPKSSGDIGNTVATALNRGVFDPTLNPAYATQPYCPTVAQIYPVPAAPTQNLWSTVVWATAKNPTYGYGMAYTIPYDDKCGFSTNIQDSGARVMTVTVNSN